MRGSQSLIVCHDCDLLHCYRPVPVAKAAKCRRCGAILYQHKVNSLERTFALSLAAFIFFVLANSFPFLALSMEGQVVHTTLITGVMELYNQEMVLLALLVFITSILVPLMQVIGLLYVLVPIRFDFSLPYATSVFRVLRKLEPWSMMEVFMLGLLVSVVKLNSMADIVAGVAVWSFAALILVLAWAASTLDAKEVWDKLGWHQ